MTAMLPYRPPYVLVARARGLAFGLGARLHWPLLRSRFCGCVRARARARACLRAQVSHTFRSYYIGFLLIVLQVTAAAAHRAAHHRARLLARTHVDSPHPLTLTLTPTRTRTQSPSLPPLPASPARPRHPF